MELLNKSKSYKHNNTTVYSCQYHIIFCPKYRRSVLDDKIQNRLKEIILNLQCELNFEVIEMEIMPDHVHLLLDIDPNVGISKVITVIKGHSSRILRDEFPRLKSRLPTLWTRSKFVSTVGSVSLDVVKRYIENQKNV